MAGQDLNDQILDILYECTANAINSLSSEQKTKIFITHGEFGYSIKADKIKPQIIALCQTQFKKLPKMPVASMNAINSMLSELLDFALITFADFNLNPSKESFRKKAENWFNLQIPVADTDQYTTTRTQSYNYADPDSKANATTKPKR